MAIDVKRRCVVGLGLRGPVQVAVRVVGRGRPFENSVGDWSEASTSAVLTVAGRQSSEAPWLRPSADSLSSEADGERDSRLEPEEVGSGGR
jgi:hypothetical protein